MVMGIVVRRLELTRQGLRYLRAGFRVAHLGWKWVGGLERARMQSLYQSRKLVRGWMLGEVEMGASTASALSQAGRQARTLSREQPKRNGDRFPQFLI